MQEVSQWASSLEFWEQAALEKLVVGTSLKDEDYDELLRYLLEDKGLAASPRMARIPLTFPKTLDVSQPMNGSVRLTSVSNFENVNALVEGQALDFGPALTAIYGGNGSGKSGYARVLGCASFTRGDRDILPDVTRPVGKPPKLSAELTFERDTIPKKIRYVVGGPCSELATFYVFDSTSVRVHITQQNTLSFSPSGLSYLTQLADATDKVRERLRVKIDACSKPHNFGALFLGKSEISDLVSGLSSETDVDKLRRLSGLSPAQEAMIGDLELRLARLRAEDVRDTIDTLRRKIGDLKKLVTYLQAAQDELNSASEKSLHRLLVDFQALRSAAESVRVDQLKNDYFTKTGSEIWYRFVSAAKGLASAEFPIDDTYPHSDDRCLLCQQSLTPDARDLILRLWRFLESDAQSRLDDAQKNLLAKRGRLTQISLTLFGDQLVSYRHLQSISDSLLANVLSYIQDLDQRREQWMSAIDAHTNLTIHGETPNNPVSALNEAISAIEKDCIRLEERDHTAEIGLLENEMREHVHRRVLGQNLSAITDYVEMLKWAKRANRIGGNTANITRKHNDLFKALVTDRYVDLFQQTLATLGRPLKVRVTTSGRKGATYKQISLQTDPTIPSERSSPDKVLSEGEKRAVALADFLTEVALDTTSSGIILDDPVTSLDLEWRNAVASLLVKESKKRQVIVFTHDLPFLYFLKQGADVEKVETRTHWIKRGDHDDRPGYVFLDNSPALEREYRKSTRAREIYVKSKTASAADQEALLKEGFAALRTSYEAFIMFDILNEVVLRFEERVSFGRLADVVWDQSIVKKVIGKCELLSRFIEGHLHSDAFAAQKPDAAMLLREIEAFEATGKELKALKSNRK